MVWPTISCGRLVVRYVVTFFGVNLITADAVHEVVHRFPSVVECLAQRADRMDAIQRERLLQRTALELLAVQSKTGIRVFLFVRVRTMSVQAVVLYDEDHVKRTADATHEEFGEIHGKVLDIICVREREREKRN